MEFFSTATDSRPMARALAAHYAGLGMVVRAEKAYSSSAPYVTTIIATRDWHPTILLEVLEEAVYPRLLRGLRNWLFAERLNVELYVAFHPDSSGNPGSWSDLRSDGVGIVLVEKSGRTYTVSVVEKARNPALVVNAEPTLRLGLLTGNVAAAVNKFNTGERKDGLRDMVDIVEGVTTDLAILASRRHWLVKDESDIEAMNWSNKINHLAARESYAAGQEPLIGDKLKQDLHSFRGARNLVDHNVRGSRKTAEQQRQFHERMVQGPRLVHDLLSLWRRVREGRASSATLPPVQTAA